MSSTAIAIGPGVILEPHGWASRLGRALHTARERRQVSLRTLAHDSGGRFSARELRQFERGRLPAGNTLSQLLAELYQIELESIAPPRRSLEVDLAAGVVAAGGAIRRLDEAADRTAT